MLSKIEELIKKWINKEGEALAAYDEEADQNIALKYFLAHYNFKNIDSLTIKEYAYGNKTRSDVYNCTDFSGWTFLDFVYSVHGSIRAQRWLPLKYFGFAYSKKSKKVEYLGDIDQNECLINHKEFIRAIISENPDVTYRLYGHDVLKEMAIQKISYLFHPDKEIPIFSKSHIDRFLELLDIEPQTGATVYEKRMLLREFYDEYYQDRLSPFQFMKFLYDSEDELVKFKKDGGKKGKDTCINEGLKCGDKKEVGLNDALADNAGTSKSVEAKKRAGKKAEAFVKQCLRKKRITVEDVSESRKYHYDLKINLDSNDLMGLEVKNVDKGYFYLSNSEIICVKQNKSRLCFYQEKKIYISLKFENCSELQKLFGDISVIQKHVENEYSRNLVVSSIAIRVSEEIVKDFERVDQMIGKDILDFLKK